MHKTVLCFAVPATVLLGLLLGGCSSGKGYAPTGDVATSSITPPRPAQSMAPQANRPPGGYAGLGREQSPPPLRPAPSAKYSWNGNPTRIQEGTAPPSAPPAPPRVTSNGERVITVRPGDTLYSLAHHYGVTVAALAERNNLMTPALKAGQTLALPPNAR